MNRNREESHISQLERFYKTPGHPLFNASLNSIYEYFNKELSRNSIKQFLSEQHVHTVHKESRKSKVFNPVRVYVKRGLMEMDLVDISHLSKYNKNTRYLLTCIDSFTKAAFIQPLTTKGSDEVLSAFKKMYAQMTKDGDKVAAICIDRGSEFINSKMKNFLSQEHIQIRHPLTVNHCPTIERFNRSIQSLISRYCTTKSTSTYVNALPEILNTYLSRKHRSIQMSPKDGENPLNHQKIRDLNEKRYLKVRRRKPQLKKGYLVRIILEPQKFRRSYQQQNTEEVFRIHSINLKHKIPLYQIENFVGDEIIRGQFYDWELTLVSPKTKFKINRVVQTRGDKKKVNFKGLPLSVTDWVTKDQYQRHLASGRPNEFQPLLKTNLQNG